MVSPSIISRKRQPAVGGAADIASAKRLLDHALSGLQALNESLGDAFVSCLDLMATVKGRVIVSGMGKSGHIGHKIAATLASTGTPAFFVHAGEAGHGDLGMITEDDALLAISNSGETSELVDLVSYSRRFEIPLVAMTSVADSSLGQAADVVLVIPDVAEACPLGLAPTTSTTLMITLGDAIAVALLERRGFTAEDYKALHPGGKLGRTLLKVEELMHVGDELPVVTPDASMASTILTMTEKTFGVAAVVGDDGRIVGIVTDGDLRRHMSDNLFSLSTKDVMTANPKVTSGSILAAEALRRMNKWKITCLFVVEDGRPVGILRMHDILLAGVA